MINCDRWSCDISESCEGCWAEPNCLEHELRGFGRLPCCSSCEKKDDCRVYPLLQDFKNGKRDRHLDPID